MERTPCANDRPRTGKDETKVGRLQTADGKGLRNQDYLFGGKGTRPTPPSRRYPALHQSCTRLKMSQAAAGDL